MAQMDGNDHFIYFGTTFGSDTGLDGFTPEGQL